ncbi:MAG: Nramp family divalent metal transporter [Bacteroidia bacterium]|nr:Nramp family divalent metal transporter [Bacteroidia bacterium]
MWQKPSAVSTYLSLSEFNSTVSTQKAGFLRKMFAFMGPGILVSIGYMDPGNWATGIEGGSKFGYQLLWIMLLSNLMAILLQSLTIKLGIVAQKDLAQACRDYYAKPVSLMLWILCEIAIIACDLAEVLGCALGLKLLFGLDLLTAVIVTSLDVLLLLLLQNWGIRVLEAVITVLVLSIFSCFVIELYLAKPNVTEIASGFVPSKLSKEALYVAIGILGATVMPHNLYLHSSLVQTRSITKNAKSIKEAIKFNVIDTVLSLNASLFINASILIVAATVFYKQGTVVDELTQAHVMLNRTLGGAAAAAFAMALFFSGQSSTYTGTLAGQIVMEGFLNLRLKKWQRRLITRALAIVPAIIMVILKGEKGSKDLLILSQVVLSMQLPFAIIPLIQFTSSEKYMGSFKNSKTIQVLSIVVAGIIIGLNAWLLFRVFF